MQDPAIDASGKKKSTLESFAPQIGEWLRGEELTMAQVRERLEESGCVVSMDRLERWWRGVEHKRLRAWLVESIAEASRHRAAAEKEFERNPPPELETVVKVCRALLLKYATEAGSTPGLVKIVTDLFKPVLDYARLEEKRKERELAELKYRDQLQEKNKAREQEGGDPEGLTAETLSKIERDLNLF